MATSRKARPKSKPDEDSYLRIHIAAEDLKRPAVMAAAKALIAVLRGQGERSEP